MGWSISGRDITTLTILSLENETGGGGNRVGKLPPSLFIRPSSLSERKAVAPREPRSTMILSGSGSFLLSDLEFFQAVGVRAGSLHAGHKTGSRFRLKAKHTKHHSPAAAAKPRKENWRKPSTSLMMPMTGSTVHLRRR